MKTQIENFKMKVTPEQSKRVQEVIRPGEKPWHVDYQFLFCHLGSNLSYSVSQNDFESSVLPEITYAEFMAKYALGELKRCNSCIDQGDVTGNLNCFTCVNYRKWRPKQDEVPAPPRIDPAHLSIASRVLGPYTDSDNIAKIVNIVLDNTELFEKIEGLEKEFNR